MAVCLAMMLLQELLLSMETLHDSSLAPFHICIYFRKTRRVFGVLVHIIISRISRLLGSHLLVFLMKYARQNLFVRFERRRPSMNKL